MAVFPNQVNATEACGLTMHLRGNYPIWKEAKLRKNASYISLLFKVDVGLFPNWALFQIG
jgi:hypothetical protein